MAEIERSHSYDMSKATRELDHESGDVGVDLASLERDSTGSRRREIPVASVFARCRAFYGGGLDDFARERTERLTWRRWII